MGILKSQAASHPASAWDSRHMGRWRHRERTVEAFAWLLARQVVREVSCFGEVGVSKHKEDRSCADGDASNPSRFWDSAQAWNDDAQEEEKDGAELSSAQPHSNRGMRTEGSIEQRCQNEVNTLRGAARGPPDALAWPKILRDSCHETNKQANRIF